MSLDTELPVDALQELVRDFKAEIRYRTGKTFPDDPVEQLWGAIGAVFGSWMNDRAKVFEREGVHRGLPARHDDRAHADDLRAVARRGSGS